MSRPVFRKGTGPRILYDTANWNPPLTEGRYQAVSSLLQADGFRVVAGRIPFHGAELSHYDILFLVTPYAANLRTNPAAAAHPVFTEAECDTLATWIRSGGNLLLVVGHEPSAVALGNLARRFGVDLRNGATIDLTPANNWIAGDRRCGGCLQFTLQNGLLRSHAIARGRGSLERVASVISAVGSSLGGRAEPEILLGLGSTAYDVVGRQDTLSAAGRAQGVAFTFGRGRVVILADGSILSGFAYGPENPRFRRWWPNDPDNRQFTLNVLHWLARIL